MNIEELIFEGKNFDDKFQSSGWYDTYNNSIKNLNTLEYIRWKEKSFLFFGN